MAPQSTILLTGANGGLGSVTAAYIASDPVLSSTYHCIYTVRNAKTATTLKAVLDKAPSSHSHETLELDLSNLSSVRAAASDINARVKAGKLPPIRAILLNAAYQGWTGPEMTGDGFEAMFQSNYLSHWLLTLLLLGSMDKENGRIVSVTSMMHDVSDSNNSSMHCYDEDFMKKHEGAMFHDTESIAKGIFGPVTEGEVEWLPSYRRYGASKLCQTMMVQELQRRLDADPALSNISIVALNPGSMPSQLGRRGPFWVRVVIFKIIIPATSGILTALQPNGVLRTTKKSARDLLRAGLDAEAFGKNPKGLYINGDAISQSSAEARDPIKTGLLWRDSVRYTGLKAEDTALKNLQ